MSRNYCTRCDDYGHEATDHDIISMSQVRRLKVVKGDNWWIDEEAKPNGIGPVCLFCKRLIDWGPRDHTKACPVQKYNMFDEEEEPEWL